MTSVSTTPSGDMQPPVPGTGGTLPPALPGGATSTTGGGATTTTTTLASTISAPPATLATAAAPVTGGDTTFVKGADGGCGAPSYVPPPSTSGGGALGAPADLATVASSLQQISGQLSSVAQQLTATAGASGGGATPGKGTVGQTTQAGGPATTSTAGAAGAPAATAAAGATAGASGGGGAVDAAKGVQQTVQAGGPTTPDMAAVLTTLQGLVTQLTQLIAQISASATGGANGGGPTQTPGQATPGKTDPAPTKGDPTQGTMPGCDMNAAPTQLPDVTPPKTDTGGANGAADPAPGKTDPAPSKVDPTPPKVTVPDQSATGGANGNPAQGGTPAKDTPKPKHHKDKDHKAHKPSKPKKDPTPPKVPTQSTPVPPTVPTPPTTATGGANGTVTPPDPGQNPGQNPGQFPDQSPVQQGGGAQVNDDVKLINDDKGWSVTLKSKEGNSVQLWGDPHVVLKLDGKPEEKFETGYGPVDIRLKDGTTVSYTTYSKSDKDDKPDYALDGFTITQPDGVHKQSVNTHDGKDQTLDTLLTDAQLHELADALRARKGVFNEKAIDPAAPKVDQTTQK